MADLNPNISMVGNWVTLKGENEGDLCGDGIVLYLDCGGGYTNLNW